MSLKSIIVTATLAVLTGISGVALASETSGDSPSKTEAGRPTEFRFAPEDFGIGRNHTPNAACNREIDQLLEQIRQCFNTRTEKECEALQEKNNTKIGKLKNTRRCRK